MRKKVHPTEVQGYEGLLDMLAARVYGMRFDRIAEFYGLAATELIRQALSDDAQGRTQLAALLREAASLAEQQKQQFDQIFALCKPYMHEELKSSAK